MVEFSSCVPASACPGVSADAVSASYRGLLASGVAGVPVLHALIERFFVAAAAFNASSPGNGSVGPCAVAAVLLRFCCGSAAVLLRFCCGSAAVLLRFCCGAAAAAAVRAPGGRPTFCA
jgi:hypothetical protein